MIKQARILALATLAAATTFGLGACGGGGGGGGNATPASTMRLSVADAPPADGATHVVVEFTGVELTGNSGNTVTITFPTPKQIDLVTQSGTASAVLFDQPIAPGSYGQIRLMVTADGTNNNSYITLANGNQMPLRIPSGMQTGLKLVSGFTVPSSGVVDYTVDFDLRKSITCPPGQAPACILKPAMRLVNNTSVGNIQGQITSASLPLPSGCSPGVYLYSGTPTTLEDMDSTAAADDLNQPIASKVPVDNSSPPYYYQFTFLAPGTYTVGFSCQAGSDNPDALDPGAVTVLPVGTATVTAATTQTVDIGLGSITGSNIVTPVASSCALGVYLFASTATPEDWNTTAVADANQPLASVPILPMSPPVSWVAPYAYTFTGLPAGTYQVAYTCSASTDNLGSADSLSFTVVNSTVSVTAGGVTTVNF